MAALADMKVHRECRYPQRQCHHSALDGYHFCQTHILEDKKSPYQQCSYSSSKTGRRCTQAAPKHQYKESLCAQHGTKLSKTRCAAAKEKQLKSSVVTAETLLDDLEHYNTTPYNNSRQEKKRVHNDAVTSYLAEMASSGDSSDVEDHVTNVSSSCVWQLDSDSESIDSESEDMFKYAGVLTAEETTRITRDKLIRLQSLYIEQFKWLQNVLREQRRKYLHSKMSADVKDSEDTEENEEEKDCVKDKIIAAPDDADTIQRYVASRRYHRRHGVEALLHMRSQERRRAAGEPATSDGFMFNRYRHSSSSRHGTKYCSNKSAKCHEKSLPFTRFCINHIEYDNRQLLFRRCGYEAIPGGLCCERIVTNINKYNRCAYHTNTVDLQAAFGQDDESAEDYCGDSAMGSNGISPHSATESVVATPPATEITACGAGDVQQSELNGSFSCSSSTLNGAPIKKEPGGDEMDVEPEPEPEL